jgi:hypothetical protein
MDPDDPPELDLDDDVEAGPNAWEDDGSATVVMDSGAAALILATDTSPSSVRPPDGPKPKVAARGARAPRTSPVVSEVSRRAGATRDGPMGRPVSARAPAPSPDRTPAPLPSAPAPRASGVSGAREVGRAPEPSAVGATPRDGARLPARMRGEPRRWWSRIRRFFGAPAASRSIRAWVATGIGAPWAFARSHRRSLVVGTVLSALALGGGALHERLWSTPERALDALATAIVEGQYGRARGYVGAEAWPGAGAYPPDLLASTLEQFARAEDIRWVRDGATRARASIAQQTGLPEAAAAAVVWLERGDSGWQVLRYDAGWTADVAAAAAVLAQMRTAAHLRDADGFLGSVEREGGTCAGRSCKRVASAIREGSDDALLDAVWMRDAVPGSVRAEDADGVVILQWLRSTRFLGRPGMVSLRLEYLEDAWRLTEADDSHFERMAQEMDVWTENHGEVLWRQKVGAHVRLNAPTSGCCRWAGADCVDICLQTTITHVGPVAIQSARLQTLRARRYIADASSGGWKTLGTLGPGETVPIGPPAEASSRSGRGDTRNEWAFVRVELLEFEDGTRLAYEPQVLPASEASVPPFSEVLAARRAAGAPIHEYQSLHDELMEAGFMPLVGPMATEVPMESDGQVWLDAASEDDAAGPRRP